MYRPSVALVIIKSKPFGVGPEGLPRLRRVAGGGWSSGHSREATRRPQEGACIFLWEWRLGGLTAGSRSDLRRGRTSTGWSCGRLMAHLVQHTLAKPVRESTRGRNTRAVDW